MTITYPRNVEPDAVFTQETFDHLTASIFAWQQGPGQFGGLHLHPCWGDMSVLTRKYHGQSTYMIYLLVSGAMRLFNVTHDEKWRRTSEHLIANILFLQAANGGFIHAAGHAEPAYVPEVTCPITQFLPILSLIDYCAWPHADASLRAEIKPAIDRHWEWSMKTLWRSGNALLRPPMDFPGWCGVTNQDLVAIACLTGYAEVFGDASRFEQYGAPSFEIYFGDRYYFPVIGLMERGDNVNFVERTAYYEWILLMLERIHRYTGAKRISDAMDNITLRLFDAIFDGPDRLAHLSWGAVTDAKDKTRVIEWTRSPMTFMSYPSLIRIMLTYARRRENARLLEQVRKLERTLAAYVSTDGTIPTAIGAENPLFSVVTSPASGSLIFWLFLIDRLGNSLRTPAAKPIPCIHRRRGSTSFRSNDRLWTVEVEGRRVYAGLKGDPSAFALGQEETIPTIDLSAIERSDVVETVLY